MMNSVPKIRPITDLKKTSEISDYCHKIGEPVFITKNGYSDLVIMSVETFERELFRQDVYLKLSEAEAEFRAGAQTTPHDVVMKKMRAKLDAKMPN